MRNLVILISGGGSNMAAIVQCAHREAWVERYHARVACVVSNRPDAKGLGLARSLGIATVVHDHKDYPDRAAFEAVLASTVEGFDQPHAPALVVLAGFMRILTPDFVARFQGRLVNIHPSLLPAFPGLHTHQRAIDAGCKFAGATVHWVTAALDHGPILAQAVVPVLEGDSADALAARVLSQEHQMYPRAIASILDKPSAAQPAAPLHQTPISAQ